MSGSSDGRKLCFVVMPYVVREKDLAKYGNDLRHWTEVFEGLIAPAVHDAGLRCLREDHDNKSKIISNAIWENIEVADIVLCDTSAENPNVLVELGWTLRADKKFVLIKDDLTDISFDLKAIDVFGYSHRLQPSRLKEDRTRLAERIVSTLNDANQSYSVMQGLRIRSAANKIGSAAPTTELVREVLNHLRDEQRAAEDAETVRHSERARVMMFWRTEGFTEQSAEALSIDLQDRGFKSLIFRHYRPGPPDAVFIALNADPAVVGITARSLTYVPEFIFPVDYPDNECGVNSGVDISIGLSSQHREQVMIDEEKPYPLSFEDWRRIQDPRLTKRSLKAVLEKIAPARGNAD